MKQITITMLKNINRYFIDKYYDEIRIDLHEGSRQPFIELLYVMTFSKDIDKYTNISIDTLKWVCEFVEDKQDYDKLSKYGDFYYKIKTIIK